MSVRDLAWEGCLNVRDLGGHPTEDGGKTRFGAVVRADSVRKLSDEGWAALVEHGVKRIVDLRFHDELEADPPRELPVEVVHIPLLGVFDEVPWFDTVGEFYLECLEGYGENFVGAVTAVARAPEGGVVVHCHAGKDRTGLVVALLLRLAGVAPGEIAADYALSEVKLAELLDPWLADAEDEQERERRRRIASAPPEAMLGVVEELDRRYGSARDYLLAGGAAEADLERVRERLR